MKVTAFILLTAILLLSALVLRPVPIVEESQAIVVTGTVSNVFEGGENDIVIRLKGDPRAYYINRGLEIGLNLSELKYKLRDGEVTLKYPEYWTPLDWNNETRHISKLEHRGIVLFNELK